MNSRKNSFKRVAASALAVLTVAAYAAPVANVGGLTSSILVAQAEETNYVETYKQAGKGVLKIDQVKKFVEGLYEVKMDANNKPVLTKVEFASNDTYVLQAGKSYVIKTTAFMKEGTTLENISKYMADYLDEGVYAYGVKPIEAEKSFDFVAKTARVVNNGFSATEKTSTVVKQNGATLKASDDGIYTVVEGYPFELTVKPEGANTEKMLAITAETGAIKQQTKEKTSGALTMTATLIDKDNESVNVSWTAYLPILELKQSKGVVKATDVNFKNLIKDQTVGSINLRYGHYMDEEKTQFFNNDVDENGAFLRDESETTHKDSDITAEFGQSTVRVNGVDYKFVEWFKASGQKIEMLQADGKTWKVVENAKAVGKYRITLDIKAVDKNAMLSTTPYQVTREFEVAYPAVKGIGVNTFEADGKLIGATAGVYTVDWTGEEITPALTIKNDKGQVISAENYFISGATTATDEGTYTITVSFLGKYASFDDLDVTWKVVNTNKYVERKAKATEKSDFEIGYRQATAGELKSRIASKLNIVGTDASGIIITYTKADGVTAVENPSDEAGKYVATVTNVKDGKMKKNGVEVDPVKVYFEVTPSLISIEPSATAADLTYGDTITTGNLYIFVDNYKDENGEPAKEVNVKLPLTDDDVTVTVKDSEGNKVNSLYNLPAGDYEFTVTVKANQGVLASGNYDLEGSKEAVPFTVKKRDISELDFGTILQDVAKDKDGKVLNSTKLSKTVIANAALAKKNPAVLSSIEGDTNPDFDFAGGYVTAKNSLLGKTFEVTLKGIGNFTGKTKVKWILGGSAINPKAISYNAEFDVEKPRIMANINLKELEGDIAECGFYYANNENMTKFADEEFAYAAKYDDDYYTDETVKAEISNQLAKAGATYNPYNAKKVTFDKSAVAKAKKGDGILQAAIANSSVKKNVYAIPYIKYSNGEVVTGELAINNYYELVLAAEGALDVTKTDVLGTGSNGLEKDKQYVKIHAKRVDKKGYEVLSYGILYNNSDSWVADPNTGKPYTHAEVCKNYDKWLSVDYIAEKTVKYGSLSAEEIANNMLGVDVYVKNSDADTEGMAGYGFGDKKVYAEAYVTIKDAAGNTKTYYSNLADCTYGAYTVNKTNPNKPVYTAELDKSNKTQVEFYNATGEQMKASSGSTTLGYNMTEGLAN
jgi:hypothetical protein